MLNKEQNGLNDQMVEDDTNSTTQQQLSEQAIASEKDNKRKHEEIADEQGEQDKPKKPRINDEVESSNQAADFVTISIDKGMALIKEGKLKEALEHFKEDIKVEPKIMDRLEEIGFNHLRNKNYELAKVYLKLLIKFDQSSPYAWFGLGFAVLNLNDQKEAIEANNKATIIKKLLKNAQNLKEEGKDQEYQQHLEIAIDTIIHCTHGDHRVPTEVVELAKLYFERAIKANPVLIGKLLDFITPLVQKELRESKRSKLIIECYEMIIKVEPNNYAAWLNLGKTYFAIEKKGNAITCFNKALAQKPDCIKSLLGKGKSLIAEEKTLEAVECFDQVIKLEPDNFEAYMKKGKALYKFARLQENDTIYEEKLFESVDAYSKAIEINRSSAKAWCYKARARALTSVDLDWLLSLFDRALSMKPDYIKALDGKVSALHGEEPWERLQDTYRKWINNINKVKDKISKRENELKEIENKTFESEKERKHEVEICYQKLWQFASSLPHNHANPGKRIALEFLYNHNPQNITYFKEYSSCLEKQAPFRAVELYYNILNEEPQTQNDKIIASYAFLNLKVFLGKITTEPLPLPLTSQCAIALITSSMDNCFDRTKPSYQPIMNGLQEIVKMGTYLIFKDKVISNEGGYNGHYFMARY